MTRPEGAITLLTGEGERVPQGAVQLTKKISSGWNDGCYCAFEQPVPVGQLIPPHAHELEDQWSFVLRGTLWYRVGDEVFEVPAGGSLFRPRGVPHTLWNAGPEEALQLEVSSPGDGIEEYFRQFSALDPSVPMAGRRELAHRFGISYFDDWVPDLEQQYGVSVSGSLWGASRS